MAGLWLKYKLEVGAVAEILAVSDCLIFYFVIPQPSARQFYMQDVAVGSPVIDPDLTDVNHPF